MTEPEKITVTRHRCPHCRRSWSRKKAATGHIARCWSNPAAQSCKTRAFYVPEECAAGVDLRQFDDEDGRRVLPIGCPKWGGR